MVLETFPTELDQKIHTLNAYFAVLVERVPFIKMVSFATRQNSITSSKL